LKRLLALHPERPAAAAISKRQVRILAVRERRAALRRMRRVKARGRKRNARAAEGGRLAGGLGECRLRRAAWFAVTMVRTVEDLDEPAANVAGEKVALAPAGRPLMERVSGLRKVGLTGVRVKAKLAEFPGTTAWESMLVEAMAKSSESTLMAMEEEVLGRKRVSPV